MPKHKDKKPAIRFSVSLERELLNSFDAYISKVGYTNRSEAVRGILREKLIGDSLRNPHGHSMAAVVLVYDHTASEIGQRLTDFQHDYLENIVTTLHIHLDHDHCMEVIIIKGENREVKKLTGLFKTLKGVIHSESVITTIDKVHKH